MQCVTLKVAIARQEALPDKVCAEELNLASGYAHNLLWDPPEGSRSKHSIFYIIQTPVSTYFHWKNKKKKSVAMNIYHHQ